jgi:hypothetical protein
MLYYQIEDLMSFTDQKPRIATKQDLQSPWGGEKGGKRFRCYLCGHKFEEGDYWRWVFAGDKGLINFLVCRVCDGENVIEEWIVRNKRLEIEYWWIK